MGLIHRYIRERGRTVVLSIDSPRYDINEVLKIVNETSDLVAVYKVGLPYILHYGVRQVSRIINEHPDLYFIADLKLADIGSIMTLSISEVFNAGFKGVTAHAFVGVSGALDEVARMCRSLGIDLILQTTMTNSGSISTIDKLIPELKTILSSIDPDALIAAANKSSVIRDLRRSMGWKHVILSPGIMVSAIHPGEALCSGADAEIVGRLVLSSPSSRRALEDIVEMQLKYLNEKGDYCLRREKGM